MTKHQRLFIFCAIVSGSLATASASTILLGSYGTTSTNPGVANTAVTYDPVDSTVNNGSTSTSDISAGSVWHAPIGNSSYVSFNASTGPSSSTLVVPNGDYVYNTTFNLATVTPNEVGSLSVLADDTVAVFLNNTLILQAAGPLGPGNSYSECSNTGPNCITPFTFSFSGLQAGLNQLTFDVKQVNGASEGLDFSGSIVDPTSVVPEPFSLALLGTGILGFVGLSRRFVQN